MEATDFNFGFNPASPTIVHVDLNSCFAAIEQQANPLLRGKPVAVAAYTTPRGCILAASVEAKRFGVATGMRVAEGKQLCPSLIILPSDPSKYRFVNRKLLVLLREYASDVRVCSIDEMVMNLDCYIAKLLYCWRNKEKTLHVKTNNLTIQQYNNFPRGPIVSTMIGIAQEIKNRIKQEIGGWLTVSIGIAPNLYLAKIASGLHKPDGLDVITKENIEAILTPLALEDLCGIKEGYGGRLRRCGITSALAFYQVSASALVSAFQSITGYHWWLRLHGWNPGVTPGQAEIEQKSVGHSYALYTPYRPSDVRLHQILCQLTEKVGRRLRLNNYRACGIHISCLFADFSYWRKGKKLPTPVYASSDLYLVASVLLKQAPEKPVRTLAVTSYHLTSDLYSQESLLTEEVRKERLTQALDTIAQRWGKCMVFPARMLHMEQKVLDRIAFGSVKGLHLTRRGDMG